LKTKIIETVTLDDEDEPPRDPEPTTSQVDVVRVPSPQNDPEVFADVVRDQSPQNDPEELIDVVRVPSPQNDPEELVEQVQESVEVIDQIQEPEVFVDVVRDSSPAPSNASTDRLVIVDDHSQNNNEALVADPLSPSQMDFFSGLELDAQISDSPHPNDKELELSEQPPSNLIKSSSTTDPSSAQLSTNDAEQPIVISNEEPLFNLDTSDESENEMETSTVIANTPDHQFADEGLVQVEKPIQNQEKSTDQMNAKNSNMDQTSSGALFLEESARETSQNNTSTINDVTLLGESALLNKSTENPSGEVSYNDYSN
jgi:hypothetical protein